MSTLRPSREQGLLRAHSIWNSDPFRFGTGRGVGERTESGPMERAAASALDAPARRRRVVLAVGRCPKIHRPAAGFFCRCRRALCPFSSTDARTGTLCQHRHRRQKKAATRTLKRRWRPINTLSARR